MNGGLCSIKLNVTDQCLSKVRVVVMVALLSGVTSVCFLGKVLDEL